MNPNSNSSTNSLSSARAGVIPNDTCPTNMADTDVYLVRYVLIIGNSEYPRELPVPAKSQKAAKKALDELINKDDVDDYKIISATKQSKKNESASARRNERK